METRDNWDDAFDKLFRKGNKVYIMIPPNKYVIGTVLGNDRKFQRVVLNNDGHITVVPYKYIMSVKLVEEVQEKDEPHTSD